MLDSDASTAQTLTLVAIVLQLIFTLIGIVGVVILIAFLPASYTTVTTSTGTVIYPPISAGFGFAVALLVVSISLSIGILWILLDYFLVYRKLQLGMVKEAETPSLVLGIVQLIFGGIIPGILLIVSYVKIRDSLQRNATIAPPTRPV
jgi:hypothetical protein